MTSRGRASAAALGLLLVLLGAGEVAAQNGDAHREADARLALDALARGLSLTLSAGGALPVSPSTAGMRMTGSPRIVADAGLVAGSFHSPDLRAPAGPGGAGEHRHFVTGARAAVVVGVFEGFSPAPTVGGILSLDAVGTLRYLHTGDGFDKGLTAWGGGVRVGLLRESFTLPGVTLQLLHLRGGEVTYGSRAPEGTAVRLRPEITSIRGSVGKDLLALGVTGGAGVDRIRGEGRIADDSRLRLDRRYLFGGVNFTWVVMQVAGELTWAPGEDPDPALRGSGPFDGSRGSLHAAVTFRINY